MLTNKEKLRAKDKPLADLAIKTVEKCRSAYAPVFAMLPPQVNAVIQGVVQRQDALIAELYNGKITFGDYNVAMNRLKGELVEVLSGIAAPSESAAATRATEKVAAPRPLQQLAASAVAPSNEIRLALVIGNSNYSKLPKLSNPANDARSIADALQKMGYRTQLVLDATEDSIRGAIRKFARESENADIAVVYYARHGAQLNGSNYLLPADIDIPRTEADIEFAGLKVDDLVNSIGANTKILFLDACRDNPVLFKNIVKGRGGSPIGLAPASASNFRQPKPGGGVFIAYATDAGAVADDGKGEHSPFTQALLRYMQKPVSIDDMFSLVTREVRLVTKNMQRPFKYASLENIVCLAPACSSAPVSTTGDIVQEAKQSQDVELQVALQTKNVDALETYLEKYPETNKREDILSEIVALKRSEFTEWTLYEIGNQHNPQYMELSSIQRLGDRAAVKMKYPIDPSGRKEFYGRSIPDADYVEELNVYDCTKPAMAIAEDSIFNKSGDLLYHYKWGLPQYLNLSIGVTLATGSVGAVARNVVCHDEVSTPLVTKKQIAAMKFNSLSSTVNGDGELFYGPAQSDRKVQGQKDILFILRYNEDRNVKDFLPAETSIPDPPNFLTEVDHVLLKCDENKFATVKVELWNAANQLVRIQAINPEAPAYFSEFKELSPFASLQEIICEKGYAGLGLRLALDNNSIKVAEGV
jgi:uncharacterized caspase-like protein